MIFSKLAKGFTLIEVLFALTIFAIIVTPLLNVQSIVMYKTTLSSRELYALSDAHSYLTSMKKTIHQDKELPYHATKKSSAQLTLNYTQNSLKLTSTTGFLFDHLYSHKINYTLPNTPVRSFISLTFNPPLS
ncbi:MAG: prepilin-type N-terminal cleavage/methylation domain-containing protein [Candidatus Babeliales bacterium]